MNADTLENLTACDIAEIEACLSRVEILENVLRYILENGLSKEAYRRIGEVLQNRM